MRLDLSSQIVLDRVPQRYYKSDNEFELSALSRFEKVTTNIYESSVEASLEVAREIASRIRSKQSKNEQFVLALPGGHSPQTIFQDLIRMHKEEGLSFDNVIVFNIYEFYPLSPQSASNLAVLKETFLDHVNIKPENIYSP
ncbi:6-phosphogluconolactonase, partial [Dysgonomonas massiliensis]|uniref:6-phosphogluconolactonase n=1 Tax=Dysgonomonas massiliensis TaxID=2040292 RepID=UPI00161D2658